MARGDNMKKIFITSYLAGTRAQFCAFMTKNNVKPGKILVITTAGNVEDYTGYIDEGKALLTSLGYELTILDVARESTAVCREAIMHAKIIYVTGGNTFYLLQELNKKQLLSEIKASIDNGCYYVGESAGAIILAKNVNYASIIDEASLAPDLESPAGLGLLDFYPLPHFGEEPFTQDVEKTIVRYGQRYDLRTLNNHQAILIDDNSQALKGDY